MSKLTDADFEKLCLSAGLKKEAVADARMNYAELGDDAEPVSAWLASVFEAGDRAHWWPNTHTRDAFLKANGELVEAALGAHPTLKARGQLLAATGPELYAELLAEWGASDATLKPGRNPKADNEEPQGKTKRERGEDQSKNPWHPSFKGDREAAINNWITHKGGASATRMAKSAGVCIDGRPLAKTLNRA